eukprot:6097404-Amphidinium_carterae.3
MVLALLAVAKIFYCHTSSYTTTTSCNGKHRRSNRSTCKECPRASKRRCRTPSKGSTQTQCSDYEDLFVAAAQKEGASWALWSLVVPVPDHEADAMLSNPALKSCILTARSANRDKASGSAAADGNYQTSFEAFAREPASVVARALTDCVVELGQQLGVDRSRYCHRMTTRWTFVIKARCALHDGSDRCNQ